MRIKGEVFDSLMDMLVLTTGMSRHQHYLKNGFSSELMSKARTGRSLHPKTIYRIAKMVGCDPLDLVMEEDLPKLPSKRKRGGNNG